MPCHRPSRSRQTAGAGRAPRPLRSVRARVLPSSAEVVAMDLDAVLRLTGLIVVPQLAGLVVTALARWLSWLAWPAAAISAFGVVWHQMVWTPAQSAARHCGTADFGL